MDSRDPNIRDQAERVYDKLTNAQARDLFIRQHIALHSAHMAISHFNEAESTFKSPQEVLDYIDRLLWTVVQ